MMFTYQIPEPEVFGNYMLKGFNGIIMPKYVSLTPKTPAAWGLILCLVVILALTIWWQIHKWRANAYRRKAISLLHRLPLEQGIALIPNELRQVASIAYPNLPIGTLTGQEWYEFLNSSAKTTIFTKAIQKHIEAIAFQNPRVWTSNVELNSQCLSAAIDWIAHHGAEKGVSL
ncbi:DUF4381 domain-containing protein [Vibrio sp. La 4.2.2]|uniref:DUF4381 domain-containing protein n=1 Tax=unclassified Vibrio TaxID=2614977 RepID=UPI002074EE9B|nr:MULTISPECIES: DUF4381 domain-containing protein [unclassified Vibrio]MDA0110037.1 DUF4381 domain-containing protein [Vibrio sp. La 4.2.2]USD99286.1 DUF4381 domain-containing protein [Vibrio sp. SCSIO 43133]